MPTIDFTSAYRDATKGSTLKALAARRAEMQAAMAVARPREVKSPEQAIASVADTISGSIREGRLANQEAAGRERFAQLLAGGLAPDEIGEAMGLDPETTMKYQERTWAKEDTDAATKAREAELLRSRGWSVEDAAARVQAEKDAAAAADVAATKRQDDQQAAAITLADHNATIEQKQAAQQVIDEAKAEETKVATGRETTRLEQEGAAKIAAAEPQTEEAKIMKAFTSGQFGDPASPEAIEIRDAALTKENAITPANRASQFSPGQKAVDEKFAPEVLDWDMQGGANFTKSATNIAKAVQTIDPDLPENQTWWNTVVGPSGAIAGAIPDGLKPFVNKDGLLARDSIHDAVQGTMKAVLGSQFAAVEGEQMLKRAYSEDQSPQENIRRAKLIMEQIATIGANKQKMIEHWKTHGGTMEGYTGPPLDFSALSNLDFGDGATEAPAGGEPDLSTMSDDELKAIAAGRK